MFAIIGSLYPHTIGVVGTDEHPITVVELPRLRQLRLSCTCGWSATAVTHNHARMLSNRHAPDLSAGE